MEDHFGIGARLELVARRLQAGAQFRKVVNLAVEDNPDRAVFIAHGIAPAGSQVNDGQSPVSQAHTVTGPHSIVIWPPVTNCVRHAADLPWVDGALRTEINLAYDAAHRDSITLASGISRRCREMRGAIRSPDAGNL